MEFADQKLAVANEMDSELLYFLMFAVEQRRSLSDTTSLVCA